MEETEAKYVKNMLEKIENELQKVIVEQEELIELSLIALLSGGHVLLEGVPGLAKTLMVRAFAKTLELDFNRIQFTSDLMPADITGTKLFNLKERKFEVEKGPIFTNFLLGDEINRTPPKTQAGLLEAMEESSVTIDGQSYKLPEPYMIIATQNPLEYEGTYPLPEALVDRFLLKVLVEYPSNQAENEILKRHNDGFSTINLEQVGLEAVCSAAEIKKCQAKVQNIEVNEALIAYIVEIVAETRNNPVIEIGSSPRGSIALLKSSKAHAAYQGRNYIIPEDIKRMAIPTLRHRIILKPEPEMEGIIPGQVIEDILAKIEVPR